MSRWSTESQSCAILFILLPWGLEPEAVITPPLMFSSHVKILLFDGGGGGVLWIVFFLSLKLPGDDPCGLDQHTPQICSGIVFIDGGRLSGPEAVVT